MRIIFTAFQYLPFGLLKRAVSRSKTVRFATPNGIFCKPFDSQRVTRLLKANFHSEFYLHRQSLLFVFFTVLFFLSSSLLSPIILFSTLILFPSTVPEFVHLRIPSTPSPSADPTSPTSLFLLFVLSIPPPRLLYFSSPSSLFLLPVFSISPLCPLYFSSSSSLFLFLPHLFPSLSSSIFSLISLFHYSSCHDSASFAFHPTELTRSHIRYNHQP